MPVCVRETGNCLEVFSWVGLLISVVFAHSTSVRMTLPSPAGQRVQCISYTLLFLVTPQFRHSSFTITVHGLQLLPSAYQFIADDASCLWSPCSSVYIAVARWNRASTMHFSRLIWGPTILKIIFLCVSFLLYRQEARSANLRYCFYSGRFLGFFTRCTNQADIWQEGGPLHLANFHLDWFSPSTHTLKFRGVGLWPQN